MNYIKISIYRLYETIIRLLFLLEDFIFEKKYALDLRGVIKNVDLSVSNKNSFSHASAYQAVWCRNLNQLLHEALKTGYKFENFIDIGSGKGKACIYSYTKNLFPKIIGIEFSEPLIEIANKNKNKMNSNTINFICEDAANYKLPNELNLVFMFNPFDLVVLEKFISSNLNHFIEHNSLIAYANDIHGKYLTEVGFKIIFENKKRKIAIYKIIK
jgi:hypothetical protein